MANNLTWFGQENHRKWHLILPMQLLSLYRTLRFEAGWQEGKSNQLHIQPALQNEILDNKTHIKSFFEQRKSSETDKNQFSVKVHLNLVPVSSSDIWDCPASFLFNALLMVVSQKTQKAKECTMANYTLQEKFSSAQNQPKKKENGDMFESLKSIIHHVHNLGWALC